MKSEILWKSNFRQLSRSSTSSSQNSESSNDPLLDPEKQSNSESQESSPFLPAAEQTFVEPRKSLCNRVFQLLVWSFLAMCLVWAIGALFYGNKKFETHLQVVEMKNGEMEVSHWSTQPDEPSAVFYADPDLNNRWTISINPSQQFPLTPEELSSICVQAHNMPHKLHMDEHRGHPSYYHQDPDYMQIQEAIEIGTLPMAFPPHSNSVVLGNTSVGSDAEVCKRSLTFILQSPSAGLGPTLLSLWLAYGMAQRENRAFFIDDRDWIYGSWSTFFTSPPAPSCKPPPETWRTPCPHQADHLLVSTATSFWTFGHGFEEEFEDPRGMEVYRQKEIFAMMRAGYEALFHLSTEDAEYVKSRTAQIKDLLHPGISVGLHIRHGDRHPYTQKFSKSYIPPSNYVSAANDMLFDTFNGIATENNGSESDDSNANVKEEAISSSRMILASDDADVYNYWSPEDVFRAQDRIILSTPSVPPPQSISTSTPAILPLPSSFTHGINTTLIPSLTGSAGWLFNTDPGLEYKALLARSYFLDLAVVGASDRIVCTVSSASCRVLAVVMGWDRAVLQEQWRNVDGEWWWTGVRW